MKEAIAKILKICVSRIKKVEEWANVFFVVASGIGGRFVSKRTMEEKVLNFGKHRGLAIKNVPYDYLEWGKEKLNSDYWRNAFANEISRRDAIDKEMFERLKKDSTDEKANSYFLSKFEAEVSSEISNSGCEWEYDNVIPEEEAHESLKRLHQLIEFELMLEKFDSEFITETEKEDNILLNREILQKLIDAEFWIFSDNDPPEELFSTRRRREIGMDYLSRRRKLVDSFGNKYQRLLHEHGDLICK